MAESGRKEFRLEDYVVPIEDQLAAGISPHLTSMYRRFRSPNVIDLVKYRRRQKCDRHAENSAEPFTTPP